MLHLPQVKRVLWFAVVALTGCAKRYPVEGLVIQMDTARRTMLVSHRPIAGYMPAMTMPFHIAPGEPLEKLAPGTRVKFELRISKNASVARRIEPRETKLDIPVPVPSNKLVPGASVPDFGLTDQSGRTVRLADYRGRVVVIDFIYTRCPLPDVCPRLSANFAYLAKRMRGRELTMLSITIDPQYDTSAVLAEYARRWGADDESWRFLTGPIEQVRDIAGLFGLVYWPEEGSITHTVATVVISRDGKLAALIEGSSYRAEQLRDLVENALAERPHHS